MHLHCRHKVVLSSWNQSNCQQEEYKNGEAAGGLYKEAKGQWGCTKNEFKIVFTQIIFIKIHIIVFLNTVIQQAYCITVFKKASCLNLPFCVHDAETT